MNSNASRKIPLIIFHVHCDNEQALKWVFSRKNINLVWQILCTRTAESKDLNNSSRWPVNFKNLNRRRLSLSMYVHISLLKYGYWNKWTKSEKTNYLNRNRRISLHLYMRNSLRPFFKGMLRSKQFFFHSKL